MVLHKPYLCVLYECIIISFGYFQKVALVVLNLIDIVFDEYSEIFQNRSTGLIQ